MIEYSSSQWRYRGSAVLFRTKLLSRLLGEGDVVVVPLSEALGWLTTMPERPPASGNGGSTRTILIGGLDPILEQMPLRQAEDFLRLRCRRLIHLLQDRWEEVGIAFGTNISPQSLRVDHNDQVLLRRDDESEVRLSSSLWNGAAGRDLFELSVTEEARIQKTVEGYYVRRLS